MLRVESLVVGDHCLFEPFGDIHSCLACALGELLLGEHHKKKIVTFFLRGPETWAHRFVCP